MTDHLTRTSLLISQGRFERAEEAVRRQLTEDPDHAYARALLALSLAGQEKYAGAEREARAAVELDPDSPYSHYVMAVVLIERNQPAAAVEAIQQAIRLDPEDADYFEVLADIHLDQRRWEAALAAADRGLEVDAEHVGCLNSRANALTHLGRKDEAHQVIAQALAEDPDNAQSHLTRGLTCLHTGEHVRALHHFRETLRIDPTMDDAREGMLEALRARHPIYRLILAYFLWMSKLSRRGGWAFVIGLYIVYRVIWSTVRKNPELGPVLWPVLGIYLAFVFLSWTARPLFDLLLRLNRHGRMALTRRQIVASNWVGLCVLAAIAAVGAALVTRAQEGMFVALVCGLLVIPLSAVFRCTPGWPQTMMTICTALTAACGIAAMPLLFIAWRLEEDDPTRSSLTAFGGLFAVGFFAGAVLSPWIGNWLSSVRPKR